MPSERACREKRNGTSFRFVALYNVEEKDHKISFSHNIIAASVYNVYRPITHTQMYIRTYPKLWKQIGQVFGHSFNVLHRGDWSKSKEGLDIVCQRCILCEACKPHDGALRVKYIHVRSVSRLK